MMKTVQTMLVIVAAWTLLAPGCGKAPEPAARQNAGETKAVDVRIREVVPETFAEKIQVVGIVKAVDEALVSAEESGVVKEWKVEKGSRVSRGQVLALLKDDLLKPMYEGALAQYKTAQLNYEKQQKVFEEQAVSEMVYKSAEFTRDAARAQADLIKARWEHTRITSPINGILDDRMVKTGEMASPGMPVARVVSLDVVKVLLSVPERYASLLAVGATVSFTVTTYPGTEFGGKTRFVGATVVADNRTIPVEVQLPNPGHRLKPEMIARAQLLQAAVRKVILVDEQVIRQVDQGRYVVFVVENDRALQREVTLGSRDASRIEIQSGLKSGDRLVVEGFQNLAAGQKVVIAH